MNFHSREHANFRTLNIRILANIWTFEHERSTFGSPCQIEQKCLQKFSALFRFNLSIKLTSQFEKGALLHNPVVILRLFVSEIEKKSIENSYSSTNTFWLSEVWWTEVGSIWIL